MRRLSIHILWFCTLIVGLTFAGNQGWMTPAHRPVSPQTMAASQTADIPEFILILSIPGFSFQEWTEISLTQMPHLKSLLDRSALAALNVRTPERGIEDVYLSINSGAAALAPADVKPYPVGEDQSEVEERYFRYTGYASPTLGTVVPEIGYLTSLNSTQTYDAHIGRLGDVLHANLVRTAVFGTRVEGGEATYAPLFLMTSSGAVAAGDVSERMMKRDVLSPYGWRTDVQAIVGGIRDFLGAGVAGEAGASAPGLEVPADAQASSVIVVEYSDWYRWDQERRSYEAGRREDLANRELKRVDEFIEEMKSVVDSSPHAQLWIMSPLPHTRAARAKLHVTPFLIYENKKTNEPFHNPSNRPIAKESLQHSLVDLSLGMRENKKLVTQGSDLISVAPLSRSDGSERRGSGILTSPTTRRSGLISQHDLGPTLLAELGLGIDQLEGWTGFPVELEERTDALQWLLDDVHKMQNVYQLRTDVVIPFVFYEVLVLLVSLLMLLLKQHKVMKWLRIPLLSLLVAPLFILLLGFLPDVDPYIQLLILVAAVVMTSAGLALFSNEQSMLVISVCLTMVLIIDGLTGARLIRYSIMGYDPMIGARYYGIGNEYMGVLVGSAILAVALAMQLFQHRKKVRGGNAGHVVDRQHEAFGLPSRLQRRTYLRISWRMVSIVVLLIFISITVYMAHPRGGTNAGGALTASAAFGYVWIRMFGSRKIRQISLWRLALLVGGLLMVGLLLLWACNQWLVVQTESAGKSHIGRAMDLLSDGRLDLIAGIILRKLQMNYSLIGVSSWSKVLLTSIFVMAVVLLRPRGVMRQWQEIRPYWLNGFTAIIIGSIVALALNDSGIVAAGTMIIFAAAPILLLISDQYARARREH